MRGPHAAFEQTKTNLMDSLAFVDIVGVDDIQGLLPKPTPPYPIREGLALRLANGPASEAHQRAPSPLNSLVALAPAMNWVVMSSAFALLSGKAQNFKHPGYYNCKAHSPDANRMATTLHQGIAAA